MKHARHFLLMVATLLCSIAVRAEGATALPQMSTDLENPVYYTISNTRSTSGKYLYYAGDNVGLRDANDITLASLFYFTGTAEACYIHNAATTKKVASVTSWTDAGIEWTIGVTPYGDGTTGLCICPKGNTQGFDYWNEFTHNDGYTTYAPNDAGSVFVIEPYTGAYPPEVPEVKPSISSLADADPTKCYTINTAGRGAWTVSADGTMFSSTGYEGFDIDPADTRQQFAILSLNDEDYYLYSVSAKKFIKQGRTLVAGIADAIEFVDASVVGEGRVMVYFKDFGGSYVNVNEREGLVVNSWSTIDAGNAVLISEAGDFDAGEALAMLQAGEQMELEALKTQVKELVTAHAGNHSSVPAIGQYSTSAYEALVAVADVENLTKEELEEAIAAFEAAKCLPVFTIDGVYSYAAGMSIYENVDGSLLWKETDRNDESMLWVFDMNETVVGVTDKVVVKNLATRNLFWGAAFVQVTETSESIADDGLFLFYTEGVGYPVHADEGRKSVVRWNNQSANSASAWKFTFVGTTYEILDLPVAPETPSGPVTSLSDADPTKCYSISTTTRGAWAVDTDGTRFSTTGVEKFDVDAADARQQFAILSANAHDYYLYSVSAKKFVKRDRSLAIGAGDAIEFVDASSQGAGRVMVRFRDIANANINIGGDNQMIIDSWSTIDAGNAVLIAEAGDFDATEALAALADPEGAELNALIAQVEALVEANVSNHAVEPALGQYSTAAYEALSAAVDADNVSKASLEAAIAAFEAAKCLPVFTINGVYGYVDGSSICENGGLLYWKKTDRADRTMLWTFDMTDTIVGVTDRVVVKNLGTGNYFDNAFFVQIAPTRDSIAVDGVYLIYPEGMGLPLYALSSGRVNRGYSWSANSPSGWEFVFAGTTYGINELPVEPDVLEPPVFTETVDATMPLDYHAAADGWIEGTEWYDEEEVIVSYTSPMYRFEEKVETFRIAVVKSQGKEQFFCLSELEFYDANGVKIELTEANVTSNADHNALNPSAPDGGGIAALFDGKTTTYFHSAWQNIPDEVHYLEVTLPNGGYDTFGFRMISRANDGTVDQSHTFPRRMIITDGDYQRMALSYLSDEAEMLDLYPFPELGYYYDDFSYLREAISEAKDLVDNNASEAECEAMVTELLQALKQYKANETPCLRMPEPGKVYHIISAFENFYVNQQVEKAITVNDTLNTLWWEDVNSANLQQGFMFEPVLNGLGNIATQEMNYVRNGVKVVEKHYFFRMKHAATGLYVDYDDAGKFHLVEQPCTLRLSQPGNKHEGQFNILTSRYMGGSSYQTQYLHAGDHNGGVAGTHQGAYGGIGGVSSGIISYYGGAGTPAAWYIREMHELPYTMPVSDAVFRSGFIHFDAADVITLTADRECSFAGLSLRDEYGNWLHSLDSEVSGNTITLTLERKIASCAFQFTNYEGVSSVTFNAKAQVEEPDTVPSLEMIFAYPESDVPVSRADYIKLLFNKEVTLALPEEGIVVRGATTGAEFTIREGRVFEDKNGWHVLLYFLDEKGAYDAVNVADTYTYTIPAGVIQSADGEEYPETTFTFSIYETFPLISYSPKECSVLKTIVLTFDRAVTEVVMPTEGLTVTDIYSTPVAKVKHDVIISEDMKTVTLELESPITTPGWYYLSLYTGVFLDEQGMGNSYESLVFDVYEDTSSDPILGDVNNDGEFSMLDVVMMVNAVLEIEQTNFNAAAADLNGDGLISMVDVVGVLRLVLTGGEAMAPARTARGAEVMPELSAGEWVAMEGGRVVLPVALNSRETYSAFQLDVVLPAGVELAEATLTGRAKASHTIAWNTLADGSVRVVAYAMDNAAFRDNEGALLNLVLNTSDALSADAMLAVTDGLFATIDGTEHRAADLDVMMRSHTTNVDEAYAVGLQVYGVKGAIEVACGAETVLSIYAVNGKLVQQVVANAGKTRIELPAGVYVVNGDKIIVK